jgi:transmembrane sensor
MITTPPQIEDQALEWFVRLSDVDAPASSWIAFQDWLEADEAHRTAYDDVERTWVLLDDVVSPGAVILPVAANDAAPHLRAGNRRRPVWLLPSFAAAAAAAIVVGVWPQVSGVAPVQTYHTDGEPRTVVLADGSEVAMNRHSDLSVRMGRADRTVTLVDGEAAFDVTHNPDRPFVITAGDHSVRVLGTAFNVLNHDGRFAVSVERGVVAVTPAGPGAHRAVRLTAGQKIAQTRSDAPTLSQVAPERASMWRQGVLVYRDAGLAEVADDLSRYFDKPVKVDASAQSLHFTGALQVGDEATMLKQLQDFVPLRVTRSSTEIRLSGRAAR